MNQDIIVNGVKNPCSHCGKAIPNGPVLYVTCRELGYCHGAECDCSLRVGPTCFRKIKAQKICGNCGQKKQIYSVREGVSLCEACYLRIIKEKD